MENSANTTLSEKQIALLKHLLKKRMRIFVAGAFACFAIWLRYAYPIFEAWYILYYKLPYGAVEFKTYEKVDNYFIAAIALFALLFLVFGIFFYKTIYLLIKDLKYKNLIVEPLQIMRKSSPYPNILK